MLTGVVCINALPLWLVHEMPCCLRAVVQVRPWIEAGLDLFGLGPLFRARLWLVPTLSSVRVCGETSTDLIVLREATKRTRP